MTDDITLFDVVVVGGGPAGATAAHDLARSGRKVALLDKSGRIKPCGGAIPPRLIEEFDIPAHLLVARITSARMVAPSASIVDIPIENGFVGMVDREVFDPWLRSRAADAGAHCVNGDVDTIARDADGCMTISYRNASAKTSEPPRMLRARMVIGADGANSKIARLAGLDRDRMKYVFAYHEIVRSPQADTSSALRHGSTTFDSTRCDVIYRGTTSPDFYSWIFPHGDTTSIGTGSAEKGFALREAVSEVRRINGLDGQMTIRREGAPIPLKPRRRWDDGRNVVLAGDAAGVVAPASGEGIYYAMLGGRLAADAVNEALVLDNPRALAMARRRFMRQHGHVFWVLGMMQYFWYSSDARRERFVTMCRDKDVQRLTFEAYMRKKLVFGRPFAHLKIAIKDVAHLLGLVRA